MMAPFSISSVARVPSVYSMQYAAGSLDQLRQNTGGHQVLRAAVQHRQAQRRVAAREGGAQQILRPAARIPSRPDVVALEQLHRLHPRLATLAPLQHALQGFERVESPCRRMRPRPPSPPLRPCAPSGISTSGKRQVTGSEEPASSGNFRRLAVFTMVCACSKLNESCLWLK